MYYESWEQLMDRPLFPMARAGGGLGDWPARGYGWSPGQPADVQHETARARRAYGPAGDE